MADDAPQPARGAVVDARAAAADVRAFGDLLRDAYGRYPRYAAAGVDVDEVVERHARRVDAVAGPTTFAAAFLPVVRELRAAVPDNHLQVGIPERRELWTDPVLAVREFRGDPDRLAAAAALPGAIAATAARVPLAQQGRLDAIGSVSVLGDAATTGLHALGYRAVGEVTPAERLVGTDGPAYGFRRVGDTGIIRLPDFDLAAPGAAASLQQLVADAPQHRAMARLVVDLRGNGGGGTGPIIEWMSALRTPERPHHEGVVGAFASGRQEAITTWNQGTTLPIAFPDEPWAQEAGRLAQAVRRLWPLGPDTPASAPQTEGARMVGAAASDWSGELVVLVDRRTASSGELAALNLRDWLGARLVGERTGGFLEGLNVVSYELPATGVRVNLPSIAATFADPRIHEGAGLPVDIALAEPGAPAEEIVAALFPGDARQ